MRKYALSILVLMTVCFAAEAWAHARLTFPAPRSNRDNNKDLNNPCGPDIKGNPVVTYEAGQAIQVRWEETINHNGYFEFFLSPDNDQTFVTIPNSRFIDNRVRGTWDETIRLPAGITCDNCTLRMIQFMNDDPNMPYQSCADIRIMASNNAPPPAPPPGGGEGSQDSSSSAPSEAVKPDFFGCAKIDSGQGPGAGGLGALTLMFLLLPIMVYLNLRQRVHG